MNGLRLIEENPLLHQIYQSLQHDSQREVLIRQTEKGFTKYGHTVDTAALTKEQWLAHLAEELTDAKVYAHVLTQKDLSGYEHWKISMIIDILSHVQELVVTLEGLGKGGHLYGD